MPKYKGYAYKPAKKLGTGKKATVKKGATPHLKGRSKK